MSGTLAKLILDQHRDPGDERRGRGPWRLEPDHVVLDEAEGAFALWAFRHGTAAPARVRFALLVADGRGVLAGDPASDVAATLERAASERGIHFARAGSGICTHVYTESFAAPGRFAVGCAPGLERAGALGMLAWRVSRIEAAAALAGASVVRAEPIVRGVQVAGELVPGVSGHDLVAEIERRSPEAQPGVVLELRGTGVERITMRDRFVIASSAGTLGVSAVVLPSDEVTRAWMRAHGREADWKRFAVDGLESDAMLDLDLERVEPWLRLGSGRDALRAVRHAAGVPIQRIVIGSGSGHGDWAVLAALLRGRVARVPVTVVPGSRCIVDAARASGVWDQLEQAGVRFDSHPGVAPTRRDEGVVLAFATPEVMGARGGDGNGRRWSGSLESCAAAALAGVITDPREVVPAEGMAIETGRAIAVTARIVPPSPRAASESRPANSSPIPRRGVVLLSAGDDVDASRVVPWGPRAAALAPAALTELTFAPLDPGFAARAERAGGGWLVAGREFLAGARADLAAWVLERLGVRVVVARSLAPGASDHLVRAGILPLEFGALDVVALEPGDELELPGGFEVLEPGAAVTVRNLTRGDQALFTHQLDDQALAMLRAGGSLKQADQEGRAA